MSIGYNTNVQYEEKDYHVQTEDSGPKDLMIVTLLYQKGAIIFSKKTSYAHLTGHPAFEAELKTLMREQHKEVIRELIKGRYTDENRQKPEGER